jgi:hypothetical protein
MTLRTELLQETVAAPTMLTAQDIAGLMGRSSETVSRWARIGYCGFPKPIFSDGARTQLWLTREFNAWVEAQRAGRDAPPPGFRKRRAVR